MYLSHRTRILVMTTYHVLCSVCFPRRKNSSRRVVHGFSDLEDETATGSRIFLGTRSCPEWNFSDMSSIYALLIQTRFGGGFWNVMPNQLGKPSITLEGSVVVKKSQSDRQLGDFSKLGLQDYFQSGKAWKKGCHQ